MLVRLGQRKVQNGGASCAAAWATLVTDVIQTQARGVIRADNQDEKGYTDML